MKRREKKSERAEWNAKGAEAYRGLRVRPLHNFDPIFTAPKTEQLHVQPQQSTFRKKTWPPLVQWICRHETVETS